MTQETKVKMIKYYIVWNGKYSRTLDISQTGINLTIPRILEPILGITLAASQITARCKWNIYHTFCLLSHGKILENAQLNIASRLYIFRA